MAELYVEAFGTLDQEAATVALIRNDEEEDGEDLLTVFESLGEIMRWSGHGESDLPFLWETHEAEVTAGDGDDRIGIVQVGAGFGPIVPSKPTPPPPPGGKRYANLGWHRRSLDPFLVFPALVQCFYDALRRFGAVELTGIQVVGVSFDPRIARFSTTPKWFNIGSADRANAIIAFDEGLFGGRVETQTIADHLTSTNRPFRFGPMVDLPEEYAIKPTGGQWPFMMSVSPSKIGVSATLPEWSPSAIGYALGELTDGAAKIDSTPANFVMRITRVPLEPSS